jgi:hypothetical protein
MESCKLRQVGESGDVPMTSLSMGGLYCSMMTVDNGNVFVLDLRIARIATAGSP